MTYCEWKIFHLLLNEREKTNDCLLRTNKQVRVSINLFGFHKFFTSRFNTHSIIQTFSFCQVPTNKLILSLFSKSVWILILITILVACLAHAILLTLIDRIECKYHILIEGNQPLYLYAPLSTFCC